MFEDNVLESRPHAVEELKARNLFRPWTARRTPNP
jgi:hypothetical protein